MGSSTEQRPVQASKHGPLLLAVLAVLGAAVLAVGCGSSKKEAPKPAKSDQARNVTRRVPLLAGAANATKAAKGAATLKALAPVTRPGGGGPGKQIAGVTGLPTDKALAVLGNDVGGFWQAAFNRAGVRFQDATQNIVATSVQTACGPVATDDNPVFCSTDNSLNHTVGWFDKNAAPLGSFPIGFVVAALWGRQIEAQLGLDKKLDAAQQTATSSCLAGVWAANVFRRGALEKNDIAQAAKLVARLSPTQETFDAIAGAFDKGFNRGRGGACL